MAILASQAETYAKRAASAHSADDESNGKRHKGMDQGVLPYVTATPSFADLMSM